MNTDKETGPFSGVDNFDYNKFGSAEDDVLRIKVEGKIGQGKSVLTAIINQAIQQAGLPAPIIFGEDGTALSMYEKTSRDTLEAFRKRMELDRTKIQLVQINRFIRSNAAPGTATPHYSMSRMPPMILKTGGLPQGMSLSADMEIDITVKSATSTGKTLVLASVADLLRRNGVKDVNWVNTGPSDVEEAEDFIKQGALPLMRYWAGAPVDQEPQAIRVTLREFNIPRAQKESHDYTPGHVTV